MFYETRRASWRRWLFYLEFKGDHLLGRGGVSEIRKGKGQSVWSKGKGHYSSFILLVGYNALSKSNLGEERVYFIL